MRLVMRHFVLGVERQSEMEDMVTLIRPGTLIMAAIGLASFFAIAAWHVSKHSSSWER